MSIALIATTGEDALSLDSAL